MQIVQLRTWYLLVLGIVVSVGCQRADGDPTYEVTGTVTLNGTPLEGAVVSFVPTEGGRSAVGTTDASGRYSLTTRRQGDGAEAGRYRVTVAKYEGGPPPDPAPEAAPETPGELPPERDITHPDYTGEYPEGYDEMTEGEIAAARAVNILPEQYANPNTSGFEVDVTEGQNVHDFALEG